jgi:hypothetical protein
LCVEERYEGALRVEAESDELGECRQAGLGAGGECLARNRKFGVVEDGVRDEEGIVSGRMGSQYGSS